MEHSTLQHQLASSDEAASCLPTMHSLRAGSRLIYGYSLYSSISGQNTRTIRRGSNVYLALRQ